MHVPRHWLMSPWGNIIAHSGTLAGDLSVVLPASPRLRDFLRIGAHLENH